MSSSLLLTLALAALAAPAAAQMKISELAAATAVTSDDLLVVVDSPAVTPTITTGSGTITTLGAVSGGYRQIGKTVLFQVSVAITTNGTGAGYVGASLPLQAAANEYYVGGLETSVAGKSLRGWIQSSATIVKIANYDATNPGSSGCVLVLTGAYEIP